MSENFGIGVRGIGYSYGKVDDSTLREGAAAFQPASVAVLDGCVDGLGIVMYAVALGPVRCDIAVDFVATAGQRLLFCVSLDCTRF